MNELIKTNHGILKDNSDGLDRLNADDAVELLLKLLGFSASMPTLESYQICRRGGLVIAKYNQLFSDEETDEIFGKVQEKTKNSKKPVVHIPINSDLVDSYHSEDEKEFYSATIKHLLSGLEQTVLAGTDSYKKLEEWSETDFGKIYLPWEEKNRIAWLEHRIAHTLLDPNYCYGANLGLIIDYFSKEFGRNQPFHPLVDIKVVPNYAKSDERYELAEDNVQLIDAVKCARGLVNGLMFAKETHDLSISFPGWIVNLKTDVLKESDFQPLDGGISEIYGNIHKIGMTCGGKDVIDF